MVIHAANIKKIFRELDQAMAAKGRREELVIFGSASLLCQGIATDHRVTQDVDVVKPTFDNEMWVMSADAGEKFGLKMGWLNTAGNIFSRHFPKGWEGRTVEIFKGEALRVKSLSRIDMICTKFNACCDRDLKADRKDMLALSPSKEELEKAKNWVMSLNKHDKELVLRAEQKILGLVKEKKKERGRGR